MLVFSVLRSIGEKYTLFSYVCSPFATLVLNVHPAYSKKATKGLYRETLFFHLQNLYFLLKKVICVKLFPSEVIFTAAECLCCY